MQLHDSMTHIASHHTGHPVAGFIVSAIFALLSIMFGIAGQDPSLHIPPIIIESLQCLAAGVAITAGIYAIRASRKKEKKNRQA